MLHNSSSVHAAIHVNGVTFEHRGAYPLQSETFSYRDFTG